ncbi:unnamed protein product [Mytilus coruscus]|uniref:Endonuclease/exonuclease/phosphatase domain-containing protein n=1 Tax=Mytilus coruscus TaxID=42192 RepID=A0A6J8DHS6_MYTCO|nr:unnamed protein product [Mytilus coruscus]
MAAGLARRVNIGAKRAKRKLEEVDSTITADESQSATKAVKPPKPITSTPAIKRTVFSIHHPPPPVQQMPQQMPQGGSNNSYISCSPQGGFPAPSCTSTPGTAVYTQPIAMNSNIEFLLQDVCNRLDRMEVKMNKLETIEKSVLTLETKMSNMEGNMLGMKTYMDKVKQEVQEVSEEVDGIKFVVSEVEDIYKLIRQENQKLKNDIVDIQARSMRDNLVFVGINEFQNETPDKTEAIIREFLMNDLKMSQEDADVIKFDRVHRTGSLEKKPRPIIAKFTEYRQREKVSYDSDDEELTRFSEDKTVNNFGRKLLRLCQSTGLRVCNGRSVSDKIGKLTFYNHIGSSVIDYALIHKNYSNLVNEFVVMDFNMWSDHAPVRLTLEIADSGLNTYNSNDDKFFHSTYRWDPDKIAEMKTKIENGNLVIWTQ